MCACLHARKETYYKELAPTTMEAGMAQVLQGELTSEDSQLSFSPGSKPSFSPRTRRTNGIVPIQRLAGLSPRKTQCFGSSPNQEKSPNVPVQMPWGKENSLTWGSGSFFVLFRPIAFNKAICFIQSTELNVNLIQKYPYRHTQNNVGSNSWSPCGPIKLTYKINHYNVKPLSHSTFFPFSSWIIIF